MTRNKGCSQTLYASASIWSNYGMWVTPSPQKAIWLFPLPFFQSKQKRCQPGQHLLPTEPSGEQGTPDVPSAWAGQAAGEADSLHSQECAVKSQQEGATNHPNPAHSARVSLWQLLYYFKEETLSCSHSWFIPAQNWAQEFEQQPGKWGFFPHILCQSKRVRSLDSKLLWSIY